MNRTETAVLLGLNKSNFPYAYRDMKPAEGEALISSWHNCLRSLPAETVFAAFNQALSNCKNPVTIADIFTVLKKTKAATDEPVEVMWQKAIKAAGKARQNAYYYSFNFPSEKFPGKTQGFEYRQKTNTLFDELPHVTRLWFGSPSRMEDIGAMEQADLENIIFPRFRRFIEQEREKEAMFIAAPKSTMELLQNVADDDL